MILDLHPVHTRRDLSRFLDVAWRVNGGDPCWVPPLRLAVKASLSDKHPFWRRNERKLWVALDGDGLPVGRIAAILNRDHREHWQDATGFWGFFESVERPEVSQTLLAAAEQWLRERGSTVAVGPVNPGPHYEMGVLTSGFEVPPYLMLTHNPPYYPALLEAAGYAKAVDLFAWWLPKETLALDGKVRRVGEALKRRYGLTVRGGDGQRFAREAAIIERLYNASMLGQWGFTPIDSVEFAALAADMKRILDPDLVLFVEHKGEPVGFLLALPNLNEVLVRIRDGRLFPRGLWTLLRHRKSVRSVRVILAGMLPEWQRRGVGSLLYTEIGRRVVGNGYDGAELSWVLEDNVLMNRAAELLGARVHKTWRVYRKGLASGGLL